LRYGPSPREGDPFLLTIGEKLLIDELAAIIGIQAQNRKRQARARMLQSGEDRLGAFGAQGEAFCAAGGNIRQGQGGEKATFKLRATMGHQIGFQKARLHVIPLLEGANGDLLFEQGPSLRRRETIPSLHAMPMQQAVRRGRAHREQVAAALLGKTQIPMPLQRLDERRQKRDEAFGADAIGRIPGQEQSMLDFWPKP